MPEVEIQSHRRVFDEHAGESATVVEYALPEIGLRRDQEDPEGRGRYGGHFHHIPDSAIAVRAVVYNISPEEALVECIMERVDKENRRGGKPVTSEARAASRRRFPLVGPALAAAQQALPASARSAEALALAERRITNHAHGMMNELRAANPALAARVEAVHKNRMNQSRIERSRYA